MGLDGFSTEETGRNYRRYCLGVRQGEKTQPLKQ